MPKNVVALACCLACTGHGQHLHKSTEHASTSRPPATSRKPFEVLATTLFAFSPGASPAQPRSVEIRRRDAALASAALLLTLTASGAANAADLSTATALSTEAA